MSITKKLILILSIVLIAIFLFFVSLFIKPESKNISTRIVFCIYSPYDDDTQKQDIGSVLLGDSINDMCLVRFENNKESSKIRAMKKYYLKENKYPPDINEVYIQGYLEKLPKSFEGVEWRMKISRVYYDRKSDKKNGLSSKLRNMLYSYWRLKYS